MSAGWKKETGGLNRTPVSVRSGRLCGALATLCLQRGFDIKDYPNAYHLFENEITLPLHTRLKDEDVEYVISNFVEIVKGL